ncbi:MAG: 16S rRNA (adenine(1518)-N(6)/adenine(1519)-N(6))-dimethyltransferase RsmA, partial [Eggerthellaceae bacterium]|nr:16S rRNA (adenine(1518)-N(6)/adenine(1519)-N(6))-dimethyltransferase RsmA [Eggerthellaceae bacterium]
MDSSDRSTDRLSPYATPSATREVLERHGLYTKYALGQNFLVNDDIIKKIVELGDVQPSDHVLEVGPGIGTLTAALLKCAGHVTAIEMDYDLPGVLADTLEPWAERFTLLRMNALDATMNDLEQIEDAPIGEISSESLPNKLVSNLPYAVAATVTLDYLQKFDSIDSATVMVQREVAERMMAKPGTKT